MENVMHGDSVLMAWQLWTIPTAMLTEEILVNWEASPHTVGEA